MVLSMVISKELYIQQYYTEAKSCGVLDVWIVWCVLQIYISRMLIFLIILFK